MVRHLSAQEGVELVLLCAAAAASTFEENSVVSVVRIGVDGYHALRRLRDENFGLLGPVKAKRIDVLFSPANFGAPLLPSLVPQVVTVHDFQHDELPGNFGWSTRLARTALFRVTFSRARHVIAISEYTRRCAIDRYRIAPDRISTIYEGAPDDQQFSSASPGDAAQVAIQRPYFIYPAMAAPHKNHLLLLEAFADFSRAEASHDLVLTGKQTAFSETIAARIEALGLGHRVRMLGYLDRHELMGLVAGATALVFPSRFEGFGLPLLEAMQQRVPVIAARATSIPEVAGDAALLVGPDDRLGWARALGRVASDPVLQAALTAAGLEQARRFSWKTCAEQTRLVLEHAAGRC